MLSGGFGSNGGPARSSILGASLHVPDLDNVFTTMGAIVRRVETILQDIRFGGRMLGKDRSAILTAVLSLSLATGACTAAFSLIDTFFLRPLRIRDPQSLFYVMYSNHWGASKPLFESFRAAGQAYLDVIGYNWGTGTVIFDDSNGEEERLQVQSYSDEGPPSLGLRAALGRLLRPQDSGQPVAVLSYEFWTRRFGANPSVLGRAFIYRGAPFRIVGVTQKGFNGLFRGFRKDVWVPDAGQGYELVFAHLRPGIEPEQARHVLQAALTHHRQQHPEEFGAYAIPGQTRQEFVNERLDFRAPGELPTVLRTQWQRPLLLVVLMAVLVLSIACSNVATLLIARGVGREREIALRVCMGASRLRLLQQLLVESSLMAVAACILGVAFGSGGASIVVNLMSANSRLFEDAQIDARAWLFAGILSVFVTLSFGLAPALRASCISPENSLKADGSKQSNPRGTLRTILASQVGVSVLVLFICSQFVLSFQRLTSVKLGFAKDRVLLANVRGEVPGKEVVAQQRLLDVVGNIASVQMVGMSSEPLVGRRIPTATIQFPQREAESLRPSYLAVSPGFILAMQIRVVDGRDLTWRDSVLPSVLVNQTFVRTFLPRDNPIGKRFQKIGPTPIPQEIVGVVCDTKSNMLREPTVPMVFEPLREVSGILEVRTVGDASSVASTLRSEIRRINGALRVTNIRTQQSLIDETLLRERLLAVLAAFFAVVAMALAGVGIYGVLSYSAVRRTKEIGIRVALGAQRFQVIRLMVTDVVLSVAVGAGLGLGAGFVVSTLIASLLYDTKSSDLASLAAPLGCLTLVSVLSSLRPAILVARIAPSIALRCE